MGYLGPGLGSREGWGVPGQGQGVTGGSPGVPFIISSLGCWLCAWTEPG